MHASSLVRKRVITIPHLHWFASTEVQLLVVVVQSLWILATVLQCPGQRDVDERELLRGPLCTHFIFHIQLKWSDQRKMVKGYSYQDTLRWGGGIAGVIGTVMGWRNVFRKHRWTAKNSSRYWVDLLLNVVSANLAARSAVTQSPPLRTVGGPLCSCYHTN